MHACNYCVYLFQRKVTRQPAPYGSCLDVNSLNSTNNAYADLYPVKYSPSVRVFYLMSESDNA